MVNTGAAAVDRLLFTQAVCIFDVQDLSTARTCTETRHLGFKPDDRLFCGCHGWAECCTAESLGSSGLRSHQAWRCLRHMRHPKLLAMMQLPCNLLLHQHAFHLLQGMVSQVYSPAVRTAPAVKLQRETEMRPKEKSIKLSDGRACCYRLRLSYCTGK